MVFQESLKSVSIKFQGSCVFFPRQIGGCFEALFKGVLREYQMNLGVY